MIGKLSSIDKTNLALDAISKKQEVIAANVTNANTPGYVRKDVSFNQILSTANTPLETKLSEKIGPNPFVVQQEGEVDLKAELIEMQKNSMYFAVATRRMTSVITQMKTVTNVGA